MRLIGMGTGKIFFQRGKVFGNRAGHPIFRRMKTTFFSGIAAAILLLSATGVALADCADPAQEKVNWRRCYFDGSDLKGVDLREAMLRDATFQRAQLQKADLSGADAYRAKFFSAQLGETKFDGARLIEVDFTRANLTGASLKDVDMRNAKLVNAILNNADLTGARMTGADLRNAELGGATWIDGTKICAEGSVGRCN